MRLQSIFVLASALAAVSALPATSPAGSQSGLIGKRAWINDKKGNLKIIFSDETVSLGNMPIDRVMKSMTEACHTEGQCETSPIEIKGFQKVSSDSVVDETLTLNPIGAYPTWIRNGLRDALGAAVKAVAKCKKVVHSQNCGFSAFYCPPKKTTYEVCEVPKYWGVNYQPKDLGNSAPPFMGADMDMEINDDGMCETFTEVGGAVAGAVNGVAGSIFSLISLACA